MRLVLGYLAGVVVLVSVGFLMMDYAFSIPTVYESYSTGECVNVDSYPGAVFNQEFYSCENMPSKFYHQYVK